MESTRGSDALSDAPTKGRYRYVIHALKFILIAFLITTPFRYFVAQPFIVSGASMEPTLDPKEYLVIDQMKYRFDEPKRGDVIIFRYPLDPALYFVKRIVALPGEKVAINEGVVSVITVDDEKLTLDEPYLMLGSTKVNSATTTLDDDEYFVLGDNRDESSDSRKWGPLAERYILGRALVRLYPFTKAQVLPGEFRYEE